MTITAVVSMTAAVIDMTASSKIQESNVASVSFSSTTNAHSDFAIAE